MAFLQPWILLGWPVIFLPIAIHLLNRRRHQPIEWGAMHFLKQATRVSRGSARIRYWLILLLRVLAVAGVILVMSRPLAKGWLGFQSSGSRIIVVLDRSPSMEMSNAGVTESKRQMGIAKLDAMLDALGRRSEVVLFHSSDQPPKLVPPKTKLADLLETEPVDVSTSVPELLFQSIQYVESEKLGPTEIWCCSDLQANDWDITSGLWRSIRESLSKLPFVQLTMLNFADDNEPFNASIRVQNASIRNTTDKTELVLDFSVKQMSGTLQHRILPIAIRIGKTRYATELELHGRDVTRNGYTIPLDRAVESGAGSIELPDDSNLADNAFHFVFAKPAKMKTLVVYDDEVVGDVLRLMSATASNRQIEVDGISRSSSKVEETDLEGVGLILWQARLPTGSMSAKLEKLAALGRAIVFFPPSTTPVSSTSRLSEDLSTGSSEARSSVAPSSGSAFSNARWSDVRNWNDESIKVKSWQREADLLRDTDAGESLPLVGLEIKQASTLNQPNASKLALLEDGTPLFCRLANDSAKVYFCSTLPIESWSSLGEDGVVLYAFIQRALLEGVRSLAGAQMISAGSEVPSDISEWSRIDQTEQVVSSTERSFHSGAYQIQDRIVAINRSIGEDDPLRLQATEYESLLPDKQVRFTADSISSKRSLVSEMWQWFSVGVIVFLLAEAFLTLPSRKATRRNGNEPIASSSVSRATSLPWEAGHSWRTS
jgi:hypothetical protein